MSHARLWSCSHCPFTLLYPQRLQRKYHISILSAVLAGSVSGNGHPMHQPMLPGEVVYGFVLGRPIVPYGYRIGLPCESNRELFRHHVPVQEFQQSPALE